MVWAGAAWAQTSETNFTFSVNQLVPDANINGLTMTTNLNITGGTISDVTVSLDISGGYNGDLYAFLAGPNGGFAVLLNRVGVSNNASSFGYGNSGFDIVLSDSAANDVHYYKSAERPDERERAVDGNVGSGWTEHRSVEIRTVVVWLNRAVRAAEFIQRDGSERRMDIVPGGLVCRWPKASW